MAEVTQDLWTTVYCPSTSKQGWDQTVAINISTIIFDLGGVLVELGDFPVQDAWWPDNATSPLLSSGAMSAWLQSDLVQAFETGKLNAQDFADQFIDRYQLNVTRDTFITALRAWPVAAFPGTTDLLVALREHYTVGLFSNINELHWGRVMHEMGLEGHFDHMYASHLIGRAKPAISSFDYIISDLNTKPEHILFLDDNSINVAAAAQAGIHAVQVAGPTAVRATLADWGLL